jgi:hypothetical protein
MVYVHSKKDGPRLEDLPNIRAVRENRHVIQRMVQQLTGASPSSAGGQGCCQHGNCGHSHGEDTDSGKSSIYLGARSSGRAPRPSIRVTFNGRVLMVDENSNRQLLFLGNVRRGPDGERFVLATRENGFSAVVEETVAAALGGLDGKPLSDTFDEDALEGEIAFRLDLNGAAVIEAADAD